MNITGHVIFLALVAACSANRELEAKTAYDTERLQCVDREPILPPWTPPEVVAAAYARVDACDAVVKEKWGIKQTVRDGGAK